MIPVAWLSGHARYTLIASGHQRSEFAVAAVTAIATVALSLALVPRGGSTGAVVALLAGGVINATLAQVAMGRRVARLRVGRVIAPAVGTCGACLIAGGASPRLNRRPGGAAGVRELCGHRGESGPGDPSARAPVVVGMSGIVLPMGASAAGRVAMSWFHRSPPEALRRLLTEGSQLSWAIWASGLGLVDQGIPVMNAMQVGVVGVGWAIWQKELVCVS